MQRIIIISRKGKFNVEEVNAIKMVFDSLYPDCLYQEKDYLAVIFTDRGNYNNKEVIEDIISELTIDIYAYESRLLHETKGYIEKILPLLNFNKYYVRESELIMKQVMKTIEFQDVLKDVDEDLLYTVKVYLECNMNISKAALSLYVHRNTLMNKLDRFNEKSGYDIRNFSDAVFIYSLIR